MRFVIWFQSYLFFVPQQADAQLVTTFAGGGVLGTTSGSVNGDSLAAALYNNPKGVCIGSTRGIVYVADNANHKVRGIFPNQTVFTLAGGSLTGAASGSVNGVGSSALFSFPSGVAADTNDVVYVADYGNNKIRIFIKTNLWSH